MTKYYVKMHAFCSIFYDEIYKIINIYLFDQGGGNLHRDFDSERAFES